MLPPMIELPSRASVVMRHVLAGGTPLTVQYRASCACSPDLATRPPRRTCGVLFGSIQATSGTTPIRLASSACNAGSSSFSETVGILRLDPGRQQQSNFPVRRHSGLRNRQGNRAFRVQRPGQTHSAHPGAAARTEAGIHHMKIAVGNVTAVGDQNPQPAFVAGPDRSLEGIVGGLNDHQHTGMLGLPGRHLPVERGGLGINGIDDRNGLARMRRIGQMPSQKRRTDRTILPYGGPQ